MNGLEALEKGFWKLTHKGNITYYNIAQKELKALEIIKNKKVNVSLFIEQGSVYNCYVGYEKLTQDEFDLLKEVLKC